MDGPIDQVVSAAQVAQAKAALVTASERFGELTRRHDELLKQHLEAISREVALRFETDAVFSEMMETFTAAVAVARKAGIPMDLSEVLAA